MAAEADRPIDEIVRDAMAVFEKVEAERDRYLAQIEQAHTILDACGVPRKVDGFDHHDRTVAGRIQLVLDPDRTVS